MMKSILVLSIVVISLCLGYLLGVRKGGDLAYEYYPYLQGISDAYLDLNDYKWARERDPEQEATFTLESRVDTALVGWSHIKSKEKDFLYRVCCDLSYIGEFRKFIPRLVKYREEVPSMLKSDVLRQQIEQYNSSMWREQGLKDVEEQIRLLDKTMQEFRDKSPNNTLQPTRNETRG